MNLPNISTWTRWLRDFLPLIGWMVLIFALSSRSTLIEIEDDAGEKLFYKISHIIAYAMLAWLWWRALSLERRTGWPALFGALILSVLYAISDEVHQSFVPGRYPGLYDVLFDISGALAMILLIRYSGHWRAKLPALYTLIAI